MSVTINEGTSVGTGVGSAATILLMAIMIAAIIASIALVKSHRKKGNDAIVQCYRFILAGYYDVASYLFYSKH